MRTGIQKIIAQSTGLSDAFVSLLILGQRRPSWATAKKLAQITDTKPELWLEGSTEEIQQAVKSLKVGLIKDNC